MQGFVEGIDPLYRTLLALALLGLTITTGVVQQRVGRAMTAKGGSSIVPFELARTKDNARTIMRRWGPAGRQAAAAAIRWDFLFAVFYATLLALLVANLAGVAAARTSSWVGDLGEVLAWLSLAAGLLDWVENSALLLVLARFDVEEGAAGATSQATSEEVPGWATAMAWFAAVVKFAFVLAALAYIVAGAAIAWAGAREDR